jgi:hypothetical protein
VHNYRLSVVTSRYYKQLYVYCRIHAHSAFALLLFFFSNRIYRLRACVRAPSLLLHISSRHSGWCGDGVCPTISDDPEHNAQDARARTHLYAKSRIYLAAAMPRGTCERTRTCTRACAFVFPKLPVKLRP